LHEAPSYRRLALTAAEAGYPEITAARIHVWAQARLLGEMDAPDLDARLIAVCAARRQTASRSAIAVLLWAQGWQLDDDLLRRSLLSALPRRNLSRASDAQLDALDEVARRKAPRLVRILRPGRLPAALGGFSRSVAGTLAAIGYGVVEPIDDVTAALIERAIGLHRARTDRLDDVGPWLTGRPSRVFRLIGRYARPGMIRGYLRQTSVSRLDEARPYARFLIEDFPVIARAVECRRGRGFGGMHWIGTLGPKNAPSLAVVAIYAVRFAALRRRFDSLIDGLGPAISQAHLTLALVAAYQLQHSDQQAALRRYGLDGLLARGDLRPVDGVGDIVDALLSAAPAVNG
jgi:hypothetical protein